MPRAFIFAIFLSLLALIPASAQTPPAAAPPAPKAESRQIGQMLLEGIPAWDDAIRTRLQQYMSVRPTQFSGVSDDGKSVLILTRFGDTAQVHRVDSPLGARRQLTFFEEPIAAAAFVPNSGGQKLVYSKDTGGNENHQYYLLDLVRGASTLLTDGNAKNQNGVVSRSGKLLAYAGTARNKKDFDIYVRELGGDAPARLVMQVEGSWAPSDFSPDESKLLVQQYVSERETHWYGVDVASGQSQRITPESPAFYYGGGQWSPDGRFVYFTSDKDGEFRKLYQLDLQYNRWKCLTSDLEWDIDEVAVDPAGGGLAFTVNADGMSQLYLADAGGDGRAAVPGLPVGVISGLSFARGGNVLGFSLDSARSPSDAYTFRVGGGLTRWTESEVGGLDPAGFIDARLVRYPTFDQVDGKPRQIPAFVFPGRGTGPRPVVISIHGGPESQYQPLFSGTLQYWACELGITVICPNVRGSTGYGRSFHQLDNGVKREDSVKDIGALLDWIATQPDMDKSRVAVFGGSYGGYMVLASLTNYATRLRAGVDLVGIADFVTFLQNTEDYRRDLRRAEYGDERDPEVRKVLESISPLRNADKIQSALFVIHGQNDPRVPVSEARQIADKMRSLGRPVWLAIAQNEGHGFRKKPNRDLANVLYAAFWREHLLK